MLFGWGVKDKLACPHCIEDKKNIHIEAWGKSS